MMQSACPALVAHLQSAMHPFWSRLETLLADLTSDRLSSANAVPSGAATTDIITQYVSTIKTLMDVDPTGERPCRPQDLSRVRSLLSVSSELCRPHDELTDGSKHCLGQFRPRVGQGLLSVSSKL